MQTMFDIVAISKETPMIDGGCFLKSTKLICMNYNIILNFLLS